MARIRMAVIKCVPLVPGLSTRPIGFTYESHTPTSFHRSHPPIYSNLSNDSKFATNFPFAPSLALQKIVQKTMKWGKKYPISIRTVQISIAKGSDRIRPSFLHLPRNSFVCRPPPRRDVPAAVARCQQPWWDEGVEWPAGKIVKQRCREILVVSIKRGAVIERKDVAERAA